jgi:caa(3)-type oxidase subunit IV
MNEQPNQPPPALRKHTVVMVSLMLCTVAMVTASFLPLGSTGLKIAVVLGVALVEAFLVAGHLMHLLSEKKLIYSVLALTGILFAGLIALPILSQTDHISLFFK